MKSVAQISMLVAAAALTLPGLATAQTPWAQARNPSELREVAWDGSVTLERAGRLSDARALLIGAWGPTPDSYEVTVRLAWLSSRLGEHAQAAAYYQRARTLPGAGPEATRGLSYSWAWMGYGKLDDAEREDAERLFVQASAAYPQNELARQGLARVRSMPRIEPEAWISYIRKPGQGPKWNGWAIFAQVPWHVTGSLTLRAAFRQVELSRTIQLPVPVDPALPPGPANMRSQSLREGWRQSELYAGLDWEKKWFGLEALGMGIFPSDETSAWGAAARARAGRSVGVNVEGTLLHRQAGWMGQVLPTAFWWPTASAGLALGPRITQDSQGTAVSAFGGLTLNLSPVTLFFSGHYGTERWPITMAVPSVLTLDENLRYGASSSVLLSVSQSVRLGLHGQAERVSIAGNGPLYLTVSAGIQFAPRF